MTHIYSISGMSCNGCRTHVEEALSNTKGVTKATVNLQKAEAVIEMKQHIPLGTLRKALKSLEGNYDISLPGESVHTHKTEPDSKTQPKENTKSSSQANNSAEYYCPMHCEGDKTYKKPIPCPVCGMDLLVVTATEDEEDTTYLTLLKKFKTAIVFTLPVFLIAMSEMLPHNPLMDVMPWKYWNWVQCLLSLPVVFYAAWMFFERAWRSVVTRHLNMFTLIGIGSGIAWLFSVTAILFPGVFPQEFKTPSGTVFVYFEAATVILTLVLLGQLLEARAHGKTNSAIKALLKLAPNTATKIVDGQEQVVSIEGIEKGDLLRVKPGEKIPVDGIVSEGETTIDESMITGEPIPVTKSAGDPVSAGTINGNKTFLMTAQKVGSETLLAQIIEMVNTASRSKAPIQQLADKISGYFVPIVVGCSILTFIIWAMFGPEPASVYAFVNAIAVLIIACPCALGLATPMSVMVGVGKGAQCGVLIKNAESLQKMSTIDVVIIDKTGTVTEGKPSVEKMISTTPKYSEQDILLKIVSLNSSSEHPLAQATMTYGKEKKIQALPVTNFEAVTGKGVTGTLDGKKLALGNTLLMEQVGAEISEALSQQVRTEQQSGKTVSYLAEGNSTIGYVVIYDKIKETSKAAILTLQKEGLKVIMLTGDNEDTARAVSKTLNLDGYKAQMLPADKLNEVKKRQSEGKKVAMAGDGINDAPALAQADIGIAMGTGTDVAIESAGITLVKGDLEGIAKARLLSHKVMRNIKENLFFALAYNALGIPIAAGVLYPVFGIFLSPMIAALAMSFSSVSVISNSLRLRNLKM